MSAVTSTSLDNRNSLMRSIALGGLIIGTLHIDNQVICRLTKRAPDEGVTC